jgi:hypothetical protein
VDNQNYDEGIGGSVTFPDLYQFHLPTADSGSYRHNALTGGTFMTGTGPSNSFTLPCVRYGGSDRIELNTGGFCVLENPVPSAIAGAMDISFRTYGTPPGGPFTGNVYFSSTQETPDTPATLVGTVTGGSASRSGNIILNIASDSGATLYTFTWDKTADGIIDGVPLKMVIELL